MTTNSTAASLADPVTFAHLAGIPAPETALGGAVPVPGAARAEEKEVKGDKKADDDEDAKRSREARRARRARRARKRDDDDSDPDDDDDDDSDPDDDDDDDSDPDDDDDDDEDEMKAVAARAARRERKRCAAIFGCAAAAGNVPMAAHLAFHTDLTAQQAIGALEAAASVASRGGRAGLDGRMATAAIPAVGADTPQTEPGTPEARAKQAVALYDAARGTRK